MYLPVGFDHSTLIKVSSIRSAGWGNRSITRTSALSTLPSADRPSPNPKNPLRLYVRPSTKHPAYPSFSIARNILESRSSSSEDALSTGSIPSIDPSGIPRGMARVQVVIHRLVDQTRSCQCIPTNRLKKLDGRSKGFQDDQSERLARAPVIKRVMHRPMAKLYLRTLLYNIYLTFFSTFSIYHLFFSSDKYYSIIKNMFHFLHTFTIYYFLSFSSVTNSVLLTTTYC